MSLDEPMYTFLLDTCLGVEFLDLKDGICLASVDSVSFFKVFVEYAHFKSLNANCCYSQRSSPFTVSQKHMRHHMKPFPVVDIMHFLKNLCY